MSAIRRIDHVGMRVDDLESAVAFYINAMGMSERNRRQMGDMQLAFMQLDGMVIELVAGSVGEVHIRGRLDHLCFEVETIEAAKEQILKAAPDTVFADISVAPTGARSVFFPGPSEARIQLMEFPK